MKKKLTPAKIAQIQERRRAGASFEDLAKTFKCSTGTISNAIKSGPESGSDSEAVPDHSDAVAPGAPADDLPLPTIDDLRRALGAQARALESEARKTGSAPLRAQINRLLVATQLLLSRVTPPDPNVEPPGMVLVAKGEMKRLAEVTEQRFMQMLDAHFDESDTWPKCVTCGQPLVPKDLPVAQVRPVPR